ncbi:5-amino-6-(D-ribitylamino)uracil--L-tyrosine 4-hydroxyphenyl transferase CofH [Novosphingobium sp. BL-52-GroH]|uniref:5-amino-6-(D-ribitylamino)uracil--L-tyrosine 4-hydroxyphenyl transferase CofH n=1 Tax=Novosphingobium sp. BL-52-GroH TaxID=3349877 RepID=UPI00384CCF2C
MSTDRLLADSEALTLSGFGGRVTYSRKVFIPLTRLCRDVCHYCTFATTPARAGPAYLPHDEVLAIARQGVAAGCREALFTLGDMPEARYPAARRALEELGYPTTLAYLGAMARAVLDETGLLPPLNPGLMDAADYAALRPHSVSMGIMLESTAQRLCERGGPHFGSPDKLPARRLRALEEAGRANVPMTTGLLIGIGETRIERIEALLAIRALHDRYGHIQEVIIQNFRAKPGTRMAAVAEPSLDEHLWTIAAARLVLGAGMSIQAPPNLHAMATLGVLLRAGVNDWGGVSPVTPDHVNPEAPWPHLVALADATAAAGRLLVERLAIGPDHALDAARWVDPKLAPRVLRAIDARGLPRTAGWHAGTGVAVPVIAASVIARVDPIVERVLASSAAGEPLQESHIVALFEAENASRDAVIARADMLRSKQVDESVTYVVNRNINYTNICTYKCGFCAFSKGSSKGVRGAAYRLDFAEIGRRGAEAAARGATEVCLQGGIHPAYDGHTYLDVVQAVREAAPDIHVHAFSPLEILHGAQTLGLPVAEFLAQLKAAGLSTLPGTAAEILDPEVRAILCPDKLTGDEWIGLMRAAHEQGLPTTATIMFGHVDHYRHWARHLLAVRGLQQETGGFTEFVPLPFVHMEAPIWLRGKARSGPSWREALLMHAVARIVLGDVIPNIQASWVKLGPDGAAQALLAGANDLGGVLMDESITRVAGGVNGQCLDARGMADLAASIGRTAEQRTTLYGRVTSASLVHA